MPTRDYAVVRRNVRRRGLDYVIFPTIVQWEDRATEWSGLSDQLEIKLQVFDAQSADLLSVLTARGASSWATVGGQHPQDMLPRAIQEFVSSLY